VTNRKVFERELSLENAPILESHFLGERPVLPMALALEWLAHAALHSHPGLTFAGCEQLHVLHPVSVAPGSSTRISLHAGNAQRRPDGWLVPVEMETLKGNAGVPCYRAEIVLSDQLSVPDGASRLTEFKPISLDIDDAYVTHLFHGQDLRGLLAIRGCDQ